MTLMTGMSMFGKMSVGVCWIIAKPRITISKATTTNVYGRLSASLTIHISSSPTGLEDSDGRFDFPGEGEQRYPAIHLKHVGDQADRKRSLVPVPSGTGQGGIDDSFPERNRIAIDVQDSVLHFVAHVFIHHGHSLLQS